MELNHNSSQRGLYDDFMGTHFWGNKLLILPNPWFRYLISLIGVNWPITAVVSRCSHWEISVKSFKKKQVFLLNLNKSLSLHNPIHQSSLDVMNNRMWQFGSVSHTHKHSDFPRNCVMCLWSSNHRTIPDEDRPKHRIKSSSEKRRQDPIILIYLLMHIVALPSHQLADLPSPCTQVHMIIIHPGLSPHCSVQWKEHETSKMS